MKQKILFSVITLLFVFSTTIIFAQTATWNGSVDSNWNNSSNWDNGVVPNQNYDVIIPSSYTNKLEVTDIHSANSLRIDANAQLDVGFGGAISVQNDLNIYGTLNMIDGSIAVYGTGHLYADGLLIIDDGVVSAASAQLDSLSTTKYVGTSPSIYNWNYGILIIEATDTAELQSTFDNPTKCDDLILYTPLQIAESKALIVENSITNNYSDDAVILSAGTEDCGAIIHNTTNIGGEVHILTDAKGTTAWHYISSPIIDKDIADFSTNVYTWDASAAWGGLGDYTPWGLVSSGYMEIGRGYAMQIDPSTVVFKGNMNVANYNITLHHNSSGDPDDQGWNLIGNPFAAPLDWDKIVSDGYLPAGVETAIYFFDDADQTGSQSNYRYYVPSTGGTYGVGTNDATSMVPVCQGFFIKTNTDNVVLDMNKSCRALVRQAFYKNLKAPQTIRISITSDSQTSDELVYRIVDDASYGFDTQYDARKIFDANNLVPKIFSIYKDNPVTAINSIPFPDKNTSLPIGIDAQAGYYDLTLTELKLPVTEIYLIDKYKKTCINLTQKDTYRFYHSGGNINDRFEIVFKSTGSTTDLIDETPIARIFPNPATNYITITTLTNTNSNVEIYNNAGQLVSSQQTDNQNNKINISNLSIGVYTVKIIQDNNIYVQKIIKE